MDIAKKSLSLLTPTSISRCVTAGVAASASVTQQLLPGRTPRQRPFRVANADRSVKKGVMADSLADLMDKVMDALHISCVSALVLEEDGTGVDTEDYFHTLPDNATLMVLEKGQTFTPTVVPANQVQTLPVRRGTTSSSRKDVAKFTFDLYKNHPKQFIGCLNVSATLYGIYSVSYNIRCYEAKRILKEALRWALFTMQTTGHLLLGTSCYMEALLEDEEELEPEPEPELCQHWAKGHLKAAEAGLVSRYLWGKSDA